MAFVVNPDTGAALTYTPQGEWVPARVVKNQQTGETKIFDDGNWVPFQSAKPPGGAPGGAAPLVTSTLSTNPALNTILRMFGTPEQFGTAAGAPRNDNPMAQTVFGRVGQGAVVDPALWLNQKAPAAAAWAAGKVGANTLADRLDAYSKSAEQVRALEQADYAAGIPEGRDVYANLGNAISPITGFGVGVAAKTLGRGAVAVTPYAKLLAEKLFGWGAKGAERDIVSAAKGRVAEAQGRADTALTGTQAEIAAEPANTAKVSDQLENLQNVMPGMEAAAGGRPSLPTPRAPTVAGGDVIAALRAQRDLLTGTRGADYKIAQDATQTAVRPLEDAGKSVADTKLGRALQQQSRDAMVPPVTTSPTVTSLPIPPVQKLHSQILDTLTDRQVQLSPAEKAAAEGNGFPVKTVTHEDGTETYYRTFKTTLEALDALRRRMGDAFKGDAHGFDAIPKSEMMNKYRQISAVIDDYTGGLSADQRAVWKQYTDMLANQEGGIGGTMLKDSFNPATAIELMGRRGELGVREILAKTDKDTALQAVRDLVESKLFSTEGLTHAQAVAKLGSGTTAEIVNSLDSIFGAEGVALQSEVRDFVNALAGKGASQESLRVARATADALEQDVTAAPARAAALGDAAKRQTAAVNTLAKAQAELERPGVGGGNPLKTAETALDLVKGDISPAQFKELQDQLVQAQYLKDQRAALVKMLKTAAKIVAAGAGAGGAGYAGYRIAESGRSRTN